MIESLIPQIFLFIVAFLVLALFWLGHHRQFHFVHNIDPALLWINILILIAIVFVPFSTDVAGDYPDGDGCGLIFHANMFIVGLLILLPVAPYPPARASLRTGTGNSDHARMVLPLAPGSGHCIHRWDTLLLQPAVLPAGLQHPSRRDIPVAPDRCNG